MDSIKQNSCFCLLSSLQCAANPISFKHALEIYINKPQVVNKWLAGSVRLPSTAVDLEQVRRAVSGFQLEPNDFAIERCEFLTKNRKIFCNVQYFILKHRSEPLIVFCPIVASHATATASTSDVAADAESQKTPSIQLCHAFHLDASEKALCIYIEHTAAAAAVGANQTHWLSSTLQPKLASWCTHVKVDAQFTCAKLNTLTLYANMVDDYVRLYQSLKELYWSRFAADWRRWTNTDPEKFIHEDVSIAAYLMLTWRHFGGDGSGTAAPMRNFVDLGCGNGLLVYILNDQGYRGYGVDMRARKIWSHDAYRQLGVRLVERTIDPRVDTFADCDWLVANHSDELSPWIALVAANSAGRARSRCHYVLIPCCFFDFSGKYRAKEPGTSRYETYLAYLTRVGQACNFEVHRDKLRIPSTKNVSLTGIMSQLPPDDSVASGTDQHDLTTNDRLMNVVRERLGATAAATKGDSSNSNDFKARDLSAEKDNSSRNCTKNVADDLKLQIIRTVLDHLLNNTEQECTFLTKHNGDKWNAGRSVALANIASLFDHCVLTKLKNECGGIKTLLKNHYQMFSMVERDKVKLKIWNEELAKKRASKNNEPTKKKVKKEDHAVGDTIEKETDNKNEKEKRLKSKQCLFDLYHPDGCWLDDNACFYIHRTETTFLK